MTLVCSVMAWGSEITVSNFADLKAALSASGTADVVKLANDIAYGTNGSDLLNIERSLTLDGQGYKIVGWGTCNSNHGGTAYYIITPLAINYGEEASNLDVTLKNISMSTVSNTAKKHEVGLTVMDKVAKLTLKDCDIRSHTVSGAANSYGIAFYGETADALVLKVENSFASAGASGYAFTVLKPIDANLLNSTLEGYSSVTFYAPNASMYAGYKTAKAFGMNNSGSRGTTFYAKSCDFNAPNIHSGVSNAYATFAIQDDGIDLTLDNCGIDATQFGDQQQWGVMLSPWTPIARRVQDVNIEFTGDNSHINGTLLYVRWLEAQWDKTVLAPEFNSESWAYWGENGISLAGVDHSATRAFNYTGNINVTISGGTYAQNVGELQFPLHVNTSHPSYTGTDFVDADLSATQPEKFIMKDVEIPSTHEVQTVKQGNVTLYRVVKKAAKDGSGDPLYNLNSDVPEDEPGAGNNPASSFELSDGSDMTLNQQVTKAGYVQVMDNGDDATTVTVGKASGADKDQTLIINNGLDVQGDSKVEVKAGSTLQIGEGGINTQKPENIVINADENGAASLLLDPTITVNQTPNLTVRMTAKQIGRNDVGDFYWHRFALPVAANFVSWEKEGNLVPADPEYTVQYPTYLYAWDYTNNDWANIAPNEMVPLQGYTLTLASDYIRVNGAGEVVSEGTEGGNLTERQDVVYTFKGNLVGNEDQPLNFQHEGFNFFGNSYTGYMHVLTMLQGLVDAHIDGTAYMWDGDEQAYYGVSLYKLISGKGLEDWQTEVAPMQTFILRLRGANNADEEVKYAASIWGNPRYGHSATPAPRRAIATIDDDTYMEIAVKAANGKASRVDFTESANNSDAFESGYDVEKYMNEKTINLYATVNGMNLSSVVTDNIEGKTLSLKTNGEIAYTMSFKNVEGAEYAIRDNATNRVIAIEEGTTYEFAAQPNSTIEGRFEIIGVHQVTTAIENTEVKANVKGIYTIMGQYLGENFDILPAGVYVVDGVKIVK